MALQMALHEIHYDPATRELTLVANHEMGPDSPCGWIGEEVDDVEALTATYLAAGGSLHGWHDITEVVEADGPTEIGGEWYEVDDSGALFRVASWCELGELAEWVGDPLTTVAAGGVHHGLPVSYYGNGQGQPTGQPVPTVPTRDRFALVDPEAAVDECGFRMLEPHEVAAAMAFPDGYIPRDLSKRDRVKLAGNAVTPPVMTAIAERIMVALGEAA